MIIVPAKQMSEIWSPWNYESMGPTLLAYSKVGATSIPLKVHAKMEICACFKHNRAFLMLGPDRHARSRRTWKDKKRQTKADMCLWFCVEIIDAFPLECCINILLMKNLMVTNNGSDRNVMDEKIGASREHAGAVYTDVWQSNQPNHWQSLHPHQLQYHHGCSSSQLVRNLQEINKVIAGCRLGQFHYRHISNKDDLLIQRFVLFNSDIV